VGEKWIFETAYRWEWGFCYEIRGGGRLEKILGEKKQDHCSKNKTIVPKIRSW